MKKVLIIIVVVSLICAAVGCSNQTASSSSSPESSVASVDPSTSSDASEAPSESLASSSVAESLGITTIEPDGTNILPVQAIAPDGNPYATVDDVLNALTVDDIQKIKDGNFTAAICMHYMSSDWSQLQVRGIEDTLEKLNIEVLTVTDAQLEAEKQLSDVESAIALNPDVIFIEPLDPEAVASVFLNAPEIKVVGIDGAPNDLQYPDQLIGLCQADNYSTAQASAEILAERLDGNGKVAILDFSYSLPHMDMRSEAARETFAEYPGIEIVAEQKVGSEDEAATVAESIAIANPDLDGLWACWDGAGMAAASVFTNLGKQIYVTASDCGEDAAYSIASNGLFIGSGAQHPYDQGVAEAIMAGAGLIGVQVPEYVAVPAEKVTRDTLSDAWDNLFHGSMTQEVTDALNQ